MYSKKRIRPKNEPLPPSALTGTFFQRFHIHKHLKKTKAKMTKIPIRLKFVKRTSMANQGMNKGFVQLLFLFNIRWELSIVCCNLHVFPNIISKLSEMIKKITYCWTYFICKLSTCTFISIGEVISDYIFLLITYQVTF